MISPARRFAITPIAGFFLAAICILGGLLMEKGQIGDVEQVTAALIVFGGTIGAVLIGTPNVVLLSAFRRALTLFWDELEDPSRMIEDLIQYAKKARAAGILTLDSEIENMQDPFLRKGMMLLVDGVEAAEIRRVLELDLVIDENHSENDAKVFEIAAGLAPTIGIIGAVMGLIQVMKHLENLVDVGHGIAVAFVATIYGVGFANLILLPVTNRIRIRSLRTSQFRELIVEGILGIQAGVNPAMLGRTLDGFAKQPNAAPKDPKAKAAGKPPAAAPAPGPVAAGVSNAANAAGTG
jgi:chemotaxis protein MotA